MENKLTQYREDINHIDDELVRLFGERMELSEKIAQYKKENHLPVLDAGREREKLLDVQTKAQERFSSYTGVLYSLIFELSRSHQGKFLAKDNALQKTAFRAIEEHTNRAFPQSATVACQGIEGAYSQIACDKLFKSAEILYFDTFEKVFSAVEKGLCQYAVLPIENSTAGSVNAVYDLMRKHPFYIIKSVRIKVDHSLLAKEGVSLSDVREIYSHEQAIRQCSGFLASLPAGVQITSCANTAMAAKLVAESDRKDVAALSSRSCAPLYGLSTLSESVQDSDNNYTRFICISKNPEIYPGADKTSIMMVLPHKPGALYKVLARFYALGINLIKLESRAMPSRNFEFMFYFDLETSVYTDAFVQLLGELDTLSEEFRYLGSYTEGI